MTEKSPDWNPEFVPGNPLFDHLRALFPNLPARWPGPRELTALLRDYRTKRVGAVEFRLQSRPLAALQYERQIHSCGRVPTRRRCWHDLFNALMWTVFGTSKAALNAAQVAEGLARTANRRSPRRDLATLIDECGVLIAAADGRFEALHRAHRWDELFVARRADWGREIDAFIIGHGLYEQCLHPYRGLTGKAVYVAVDRAFFGLELSRRYRRLDRLLARRVAGGDRLQAPRHLLPLPILGVPGWHDDNADPDFYRDAGYFRPLPGPIDST